VSLPRPPLTTERRLGTGKVLRAGSTAPYRALTVVGGEPHIVRDDFSVAGDEPEGDSGAGAAPAAGTGSPRRTGWTAPPTTSTTPRPPG